MGAPRWVLSVLAVVGAVPSCSSGEPGCDDKPASLTLQLDGDLSGVESIEIQIAYDGMSRKFPKNVEGEMSELFFGLVPAPSAGADVVVTGWGYERPDARGAQVLWGEVEGTVQPNGCNQLEISLAPTGQTTPDAGPVRDAGAPPSMCATAATSETVVLYTYESLPVLTDIGGMANSEWFPLTADATLGSTEGPSTCGDAIGFDGDGAVITRADTLQLEQGAIDFWVRFSGPPNGAQGILSRDATGQDEPGHISVFRSCDDHIIVRIQDNLLSTYRCSNEPVPELTWTHVGINFGAPDLELFVDGEKQERLAESNLWGEGCIDGPISCRGEVAVGIDGNAEPLVIGASSYQAEPGSGTPLALPFVGAMDSVHIRAARQDF